ncbi:MAG: hypothetical protein HY656_02675 [Acidobacteria bacterium]|nr:hypothetical protein [Acidobacteriota bacterium]
MSAASKNSSFLSRVCGLSLLIVLSSCGDFDLEPQPPRVVVSGQTGTINFTVSSTQTLDLAAWDLSEAVYKAAKAHRELKRLTVNVYMSNIGLVDEYGNQPATDIAMGSVQIDDLDEVRRYKDKDSYQFSERIHAFYKGELRRLGYFYKPWREHRE